jgi:3-hydroxyisobutyrate dehydrogenase
MVEKVGFVGIGNMGRPMVAQLLAAGIDVLTFDLDPAACAGFQAAESLQELAAEVDLVILMLPDGKVVRACALDGPAPLVATLEPGSLIVDMSSSDPVGTRDLGAVLKERGISFVDAPVSGGVRRAVDGSLAIMVGSDDPAAIDRAMPCFDAMGGRIFRCGPLGAGHAMKALNNYVNAAAFIATMEAVAVGERFGLDAETMTDVLNASTGKNGTTENKMKQFILNGAYSSGFSLGLMSKDVTTARDLARYVDVDAKIAGDTEAIWREAAERLGKNADHTEIAKLWRP